MIKKKYAPNIPYWRQKPIDSTATKVRLTQKRQAREAKSAAYGTVVIIFTIIALLLFMIGGSDLVLFWLKGFK